MYQVFGKQEYVASRLSLLVPLEFIPVSDLNLDLSRSWRWRKTTLRRLRNLGVSPYFTHMVQKLPEKRCIDCIRLILWTCWSKRLGRNTSLSQTHAKVPDSGEIRKQGGGYSWATWPWRTSYAAVDWWSSGQWKVPSARADFYLSKQFLMCDMNHSIIMNHLNLYNGLWECKGWHPSQVHHHEAKWFNQVSSSGFFEFVAQSPYPTFGPPAGERWLGQNAMTVQRCWDRVTASWDSMLLLPRWQIVDLHDLILFSQHTFASW